MNWQRPRELRPTLWISLLSLPLLSSVATTGLDRADSLAQSLTILYLGAAPLLCVALLWPGTPPTIDPFVRYGANRRSFVAVSLVRKILTVWVTVSILSALSLAWCYQGDIGPFFVDLLTTLPVACAASVALPCLFACARAWFGKLGLLGALLLVWMASRQGGLALMLPLPHLRGLLLLGPRPELLGVELSGWMSYGFLYIFAGLWAWLLLRRSPR